MFFLNYIFKVWEREKTIFWQNDDAFDLLKTGNGKTSLVLCPQMYCNIGRFFLSGEKKSDVANNVSNAIVKKNFFFSVDLSTNCARRLCKNISHFK